MDDTTPASATIADPIFELVEEYGDVAMIDNFVPHQISLSDVVKNDMKRNLDWDDATINVKLWGLINSGLDKNGRYRERALELEDAHKKYSSSYVESQCLLTEWLGIYRSVRVHCSAARKRKAA